MRNLIKDVYGVIDLSVVLMIGIAFAALVVVAYIIWTVKDQLLGTRPSYVNANNASNAQYNTTSSSIANITGGFDNAVSLLLVAITIFILAIAISALLMLRGR